MLFGFMPVLAEAAGSTDSTEPGAEIASRSRLTRFRDETENYIGPGRMTVSERHIVALHLAELQQAVRAAQAARAAQTARAAQAARARRVRSATPPRPIARPCNSDLPLPSQLPGDASDGFRNALSNLNRTSGSVTWDGTTTNGVWADGQNTYCARFVRMCFGKPSAFSNAINTYYSFSRRGVVNPGTDPPLGAVVFYASGYDGHIGIADGAGSVYAVSTKASGVTKCPVLKASKAAYLGYVTADAFVKYYGARAPMPLTLR